MPTRCPGMVLLAAISILPLTGSFANAAKVTLAGPPTRSFDPATFSSVAGSVGPSPGGAPDEALTPGLSGPAIECFNFDDNGPATFNGTFLNPPDPHCAAGLSHIINIGNSYIEWRPKNTPMDTPQFRASLKAFFAGAPDVLGTVCYDPKVLYDQYSDRFVVVAFELTMTAQFTPIATRILVAVSKGPDPNGGWWLHAINSAVPIGGTDDFPDYPGVALDDEAVYVCANMFDFVTFAFGGVRLWIIPKTGAYAGPNGALVSTVYDPYGLAGQPGYAATTQPAHMYGPEPAGLGTFLVSYDGLSNGFSEYVNIIRVDNPLGVPVFTFTQLGPLGNIDDTTVQLPDASQPGTTLKIEVNDRRALNAVWRNNNLYMCATVLAPAGAPDAGQTTAYWWRVSTLGGLAVADQGPVGANDLGATTYTFFPTVMVDQCDNMAIGFSASSGLDVLRRVLRDAVGRRSPWNHRGDGHAAGGHRLLQTFLQRLEQPLGRLQRSLDLPGGSIDVLDLQRVCLCARLRHGGQ